MVRENLLEIDQLRDDQDALFKELHDCFGLENCMKSQKVDVFAGPPSRKHYFVVLDHLISKSYCRWCQFASGSLAQDIKGEKART